MLHSLLVSSEMKSLIVEHLQPEFEPVTLVWSDHLPEGTLQYKAGKFACVLNLFAEASRRGRVTGGSRDTIACPGGRAALGLGGELVEPKGQLEHYAAILSKGVESARDKATHRERMKAVRPSWRPLYELGERRHCNFDMAMQWLQHCLPRYDIPHEYVLFKPLSKTAPDDDTRAVIFPVNPLELAGLITLLGSVVEGADPVQVPQGADCFRLASFAFRQYDAESPRGVLGMLDVDGREVMRKRFRDDTLTLSIPKPLFQRMEREAATSVLQIPAYTKLRGRSTAD